jgi:CII-binding regulator of phage lambda lysogenization HflD
MKQTADFWGAEAVTRSAYNGPHSAILGCRRVSQSKERKVMTDEVVEVTPRTHSGSLLAAIAVAMLLGFGGIIWSYTLSNKVATQGQALTDAAAQNTKLSAALQSTDARLDATAGAMQASLGVTQQQLDTRSAALQVREVRGERTTARLATAQQETEGQVSAVSSAVTDVKTDVGGVKTDVAKTQSDLADTNTQLTSMKGDLNGHSSLIARNGAELEILKHKGDRNYYQFTLVRGAKQQVGTVSLELKRADSKRSKYTLAVYSDDKQYEKKDKSLNEPLQFYSGKEPMLFEIVVNNVSAKNTVTGYLSSPKGAPEPVVAGL